MDSYDEGYNAYHEDISFSKNPYPSGSQDALHWENGFRDASRDDDDDDEWGEWDE